MVHELSLTGLAHATEFKQAVWAMKRGEMPAHSSVPLGPAPVNSGAPVQQQMNTEVLKEIRDELRDLNRHLRAKA
jgi:hypothetical protein